MIYCNLIFKCVKHLQTCKDITCFTSYREYLNKLNYYITQELQYMDFIEKNYISEGDLSRGDIIRLFTVLEKLNTFKEGD